MHNYTSILDGARGLLAECALILGRIPAVSYVVVGGWSPFLRNTGALPHPGTRDVDLLFEDGALHGELAQVVKAFREAGYLLSAKHEFQLLRVLQVSGTEFVYNVDLLHPSEAVDKPEMFVDHLQLPIPMAEYRDDSFAAKSIVMPEAAFLFDGHVEHFTLSAILPESSTSVELSIPLTDEVGVIVTKAASLKNPKRTRDAYDVYLAVTQSSLPKQTVERFRRLKRTNRAAYNTLYSILEAVEKNLFAPGVSSYANGLLGPDSVAAEHVEEQMREFFKAVELEPRAENVSQPSRRGAGG